ncbi:signal peptidase I [candidate division KSB1 bacterium]
MTKKTKPSKKNIWREYGEALAVAIVAALIIRAVVIQSYRIPTGSMEDTLLVGDFLLANKFVYGAKIPFIGVKLPAFKDPKQGDIIVFKYPLDPDISYIKRCVAVEGQTVEIKDKILYVDGRRYPDPVHSKFIDSHIYPKDHYDPEIQPPGSGNRDNYGPVKVPEGYLFMMGDNRDNSLDSRYWGFLSKDLIVGEALILYFSWDTNIPLYKIFKKIRWSRILDLIK